MQLLKDYQQLHSSKRFFTGTSLKPHLQTIADLIKKTDSKHVLDYGCGKARLHRKGKTSFWGVEVDLYDPAYEPYSQKPHRWYDGVICTDVLEHIPEEEIDGVLKDIFSHAQKFVFLSISTKLAEKTFPDGRNVHVCVKPPLWWLEKMPKSDLVLSIKFDESADNG